MKTRIFMASALFAAAAFGTFGMASASDSKLDDANAHLVKAVALIKASTPSGNLNAFARHTARAEDLLKQAMAEIDAAKRAGNEPPPPAPSIGTRLKLHSSGMIQLNPQPEPPLPQTH